MSSETTFTLVKCCRRCREAGQRASWECRGCGARCCEHLCGQKSVSGGPEEPTRLAICTGCRISKKVI
jgi:hypothetical protein